jgi:heme O synthase-like polyprenyltransferase
MPFNSHAAVATTAAVALILFVTYRRVRRSIGRQPLQRTRMKLRIGLLILGAAAFVGVPGAHWPALLAAAAGAAAGLALAVYALKHTQVEFTADGAFYTGHPYIGLSIALLLIGRLVYRFAQMATAPALRTASPFTGAVSNPVTAGVFFVMAAYYVAYYTGLLRRQVDESPATTG